jgi:PAS domain S-box-containing protein
MSAIVTTATDAIITIDDLGIIESLNPATQRMFGYNEVEMIGHNIKMLMPGPYHDEHDGYLARYRDTGVKHIIGVSREVQGLRKDGSTFPMDLTINEWLDGDARMFTGIFRDETERKHLQREVLEISTQEQRRIGQDLHDGVGQELTGLGLMAKSLLDSLVEQESPEIELAVKVAKGLKLVLSQVRSLAKGLIPVEIDAHGLMAALEELAAHVCEQSGVICTLHCVQPVLFQENAVATHLYCIAQEAVTNALKHGHARHIDISLESDRQLITLCIRDDGVGISDQFAHMKGVGQRIMRYRSNLINAKFNVSSAEGGGTLVLCTLIKDRINE